MQLQVGDGRNDAALRRVEGIAKELRSEAAAQADAADARVSAVEASFSLDLKRLRGMFSTCVTQLESMQVELSQLELQKVGGRLQAVEAKLGIQGGILAKEQSVASNPRATSDDDTGNGRHSWLNALGKVMPDYSANAVTIKPPPAQQAGLKDKLSSIASSVHQVLGGLENNDETATVVTTTMSAISDDSTTPRIPSVPSHTSCGQSSSQLATRTRGISVDPQSASEELRPCPLSPRIGGLSAAGTGLGGVVAAATGGGRASMASAGRSGRGGAFTAPQSSGPSRDRSPLADMYALRSSIAGGAGSPPVRPGLGSSIIRAEGSVDRSRHLHGNSAVGGARFGQQQQSLVSQQPPPRTMPMTGHPQSGRTGYVSHFQR